MIGRENIELSFEYEDIDSSEKLHVNLDIVLNYFVLFINTNFSNIVDFKVTYIFVSVDRQISINKEFLNHDYNTDIITFNLSEIENEICGEVYISLNQVKENSIEYDTDYINEGLRVLIHGFYHLLGYNDKEDEEFKSMNQLENDFLSYYFKFHVEH